MTGEAAPGEEQSLWVDNLAGLTGYLPAWSELAERLGADTYLHPAYFGAWWECYGGQYSLSCLVRKQQGRVVGILPFVIERIWIGPIAVRTARIAPIAMRSFAQKIASGNGPRSRSASKEPAERWCPSR